jgi:phage tail-like protein
MANDSRKGHTRVNSRLYTTFNFIVEINPNDKTSGIQFGKSFQLGFQKVTPNTTVKYDPVEYRVGADIWTCKRSYPGRVDFTGTIELEYGMCLGDTAAFWDWMKIGFTGILPEANIIVTALDNNDGRAFQAWEFHDCWPSDYSSNTNGFSAMATDPVMDKITFNFHRWERLTDGLKQIANGGTPTPIDGIDDAGATPA